MTQVQSTTDITGQLSQTDLNAQDIQNIIDEFNKFQDQYTAGNIQQNQQSIIVFDDQTNRVLIGYQTVLEQWGLFVSKIGVDVTEATADQLVFNSNQNIFKIALEGGSTITVPDPFTLGTTLTNTIPHGLSIVPGVQGYANIPAGAGGYIGQGQLTNLPTMLIGFSGTSFGEVVVYLQARVDATNLYLDVINASNHNITGVGGDYTFEYYLLQETASPS